jgi:hypothetical protein
LSRFAREVIFGAIAVYIGTEVSTKDPEHTSIGPDLYGSTLAGDSSVRFSKRRRTAENGSGSVSGILVGPVFRSGEHQNGAELFSARIFDREQALAPGPPESVRVTFFFRSIVEGMWG